MLQAFSESTRAAVDPNVKGGDYYGPDGFIEKRGYLVLVPSSKASHNGADARQLWGVSEELTGVNYAQLDKENGNGREMAVS
jgi:hypothetical protein